MSERLNQLHFGSLSDSPRLLRSGRPGLQQHWFLHDRPGWRDLWRCHWGTVIHTKNQTCLEFRLESSSMSNIVRILFVHVSMNKVIGWYSYMMRQVRERETMRKRKSERENHKPTHTHHLKAYQIQNIAQHSLTTPIQSTPPGVVRIGNHRRESKGTLDNCTVAGEKWPDSYPPWVRGRVRESCHQFYFVFWNGWGLRNYDNFGLFCYWIIMIIVVILMMIRLYLKCV